MTHLELTCIYVRSYNLILKQKEIGQFTPTNLLEFEKAVKA